MSEEQPLQVARCTKIIQDEKDSEKSKYVINVKQIAKFVVNLGERVSPTDIEEGMRVGVDRQKYSIMLPLPPKIDPSVTMMTVEDKPDVTYGDVGGCKEQIEKLREVVEMPLLSPERFSALGIDPPKGALLYGPPGTGKTLCARAVANRTDATFIRVIGSELVQKYVGEGARMVRELFEMARTKKACIIFFDEIDAIGGARFDDGAGGDNEVQRTMLELITQLDGFDSRGNIKVMFATNRPATLDPALLRPGRIDRKIEFSLPDLDGRASILRIHGRNMVSFMSLFLLGAKILTHVEVGRARHQMGADSPSDWASNWCRAAQHRDRGWNVCHSKEVEACYREGLPGCRGKGDQGQLEIQLDCNLCKFPM
jgi:26S proteasome regulatory subunit T1